jgi:allantoin racemase
MKIQVINPNTSPAMTESIGVAARSVARAGTEIVAVCPTFGPVSIESYYDEYLCVPGILDEIRKGEADKADAYIIACYGDPGLSAAREVTTKPVIGIAEASLSIASILAARFSIVTVIPRVHTMLEEMVARYGFHHRVVSIRTTPLYVLDVEKDPARALQMLHAEARKAKEEDDAEAILLGCAGFTQFATELEGDLHIPVLDGVVCAVKMAEAIVELGKATSKYKTYRLPEGKAFAGMFETFGWVGLNRTT